MRTLQLLFLATLLLFITCKPSGTDGLQNLIPDSRFSELISAYTSGQISKKSTIMVVFRNNTVGITDINKILKVNPFITEPKIEGQAKWISRNMLEFQPSEMFKSGERLNLKLDLTKIYEEIPDSLSSFDFSVSVLPQTITLKEYNLISSSATDLVWQKLSGRIETNDFELPENIVKFLNVEHDGKELKVIWEHFPESRYYNFIVDSIPRKDLKSEVELIYDASHMDIDQEGKIDLAVRALGDFQANEVKARSYPDQCIEVHFSDPLQKNQIIEGLIRIENRNSNMEVESNIVKLYPTGSRLKGSFKVIVEEGVKNVMGHQISERKSFNIYFEEIKPQLELLGNKTIIPNSRVLPFNFRAVGLTHVDMRVIKISEKNIPQFLQVNRMSGSNELKRVGHVLVRKTIELDKKGKLDLANWNAHSIDLSPLIDVEPGAIYEVALGYKRSYSLYTCTDTIRDNDVDMLALDENWYIPEEKMESEDSYWDYWDGGSSNRYVDRSNPCANAYYSSSKVIKRNVIASSIGLIAKRGSTGEMFIAASDLKTSRPIPDLKLQVYNYQQHKLKELRTNGEGMARLKLREEPFLLVAIKGNQKGYLKLDRGSSLSLSKFDVGGKRYEKGINGFIFGERGVWRPGDNIYLNFILEDANNELPENHPVVFELFNPNGQLIKRIKKLEGLNDFYAINCKTDYNAPTGNYRAKVHVGGVSFEKTLKVEMVVPNRLKMKMDFGLDYLSNESQDLSTTLEAKWLHGAIAKNLNADVEVSLSTSPTRFNRYRDYLFDDPVNKFTGSRQTLFEGSLDEFGKADIPAKINVSSDVPGMLMASFKTKVFEPGGNFSTDRFKIPFHKYDRYLGIKLPKGDVSRGMLLTDTNHTAKLVMLEKDGSPVDDGEAEVSIYKLSWKWWWDQTAYSMPQYYGRLNTSAIHSSKVTFQDGEADWKFKINFPSWGRYLVRACDEGGHCTGKIVYIDWPGWAGRAQKDESGGAKMLVFSSDNKKYEVGDDITLNIPTSEKGRALVSIESGNKVLEAYWVDAKSSMTKFKFKATEEMAPNVYAHVTLVQPHAHFENDRPMRLHGVIPIMVENPKSRLEPVITMKDVIEPEANVNIQVSEATGRPMTYVVAVVDEGLLGLTRFATPNAWSNFYQRKALDVMTWDLYDNVLGSEGLKIRNLLGIGGGDEGSAKEGQKSNRFKPVVRFFGPYKNEAGQKKSIKFKMPNYIGAVRTMVVARSGTAYGSADKESLVKKPLMVLASLPRQLTPNDVIDLPVTIFSLEENIKNVKVTLESNSFVEIIGDATQKLSFNGVGEEMAYFKVKVKERIGMASFKINASAGKEKASFEEDLEVRLPNPLITDVKSAYVEPGASASLDFSTFGLSGTNIVKLEASVIPAIDLGKRLGYLIRYPHGCVEQTTSSVFPQVYLKRLIKLDQNTKGRISENIKAGIQRLMTFQTADGGMAYWPGGYSSNEWGTNYAGNFILEAKNAGYSVNEDFMSKWVSYQKKKASSWYDNGRQGQLTQAYRLYLLALSDNEDMGAMNRMRILISRMDNISKAYLALAYAITGHSEISKEILKEGDINTADYKELSGTFGSKTRDQAILLETCVALRRGKEANLLASSIVERLGSDKYLNTQATAYSLIAVAKFHGDENSTTEKFRYDMVLNSSSKNKQSNTVMSSNDIAFIEGQNNKLKLTNRSEKGIYFRLINQGIPIKVDTMSHNSGLNMKVSYSDMDGNSIGVDNITQGMDFVCNVKVWSTENRKLDEIALTTIFPSGWEIHNDRLDDFEHGNSNSYEYQDIRDTRVMTYFDMNTKATLNFQFMLNASYTGDYYLPATYVEAMYDPEISARSAGSRTKVSKEDNVSSSLAK